MEITRKSEYSGITRTLDLNITQEQLDNFNNGVHLQRAFPHLPPAEREFIKTGITGEEWNEMFPPEDEDEE
jgi:hypothetical protein